MTDERIGLGHGSGGSQTHELVRDLFLTRLGDPTLSELLDSAVIGDLALTTDGYVVTPRFFPGGDIGRLAVCGTVNDLAMVGAEPLGLTAGFILEEGLAIEELERIVESMAGAASEAGARIVAGDTKVVPRGACDGVFITTSGVGRLVEGFAPAPGRAAVGDAVIVSGTIGDHGMAVLACREGLSIGGDLASDVAPLAGLVRRLRECGVEVHALRDPTRGGVAQSLIEIAEAAGRRIVLEEQALPVRPAVRAASELLGLEPLHVANEGKLLALVPAKDAEAAIDLLRSDPLGAAATMIGEVVDGPAGVELVTSIGGRRPIRMPAGELLPRIC